MEQRNSVDYPLLRWQEAIWLLIALLIPLFVNFWVEQQFEASKVWLLRTLVWVLTVAWLLGWMAGQRPKLLALPIRNLLTLLSFILLLSTFLSPHHPIAIFGTLERAHGVLTQISYLLLFWCVTTLINSEQSHQLLTTITVTAIPICLLGLLQAAGWQPLPVLSDARSPLTTTLGRANFTGAYLALMLPLTLTAAQSSTADWRRVGYGVLFGAEISVIVLTQARAAWIAAVVGISVLLWLQHAQRWTIRAHWLSVLGGVAALTGALGLLLQQGIINGGSIAARWTIWQALLQLLWPRIWLGYGADTLELYFPSVYPPQLVYYQGRGVIVDRAHNWLLDWSLNYGIFATIVFCALVVVILRRGWQQMATPKKSVDLRAGEKPFENHWLAACIAGACAQLVGNIFLFEVAATAVVFWLLLAVITAATTKSQPPMSELLVPLWAQSSVIAITILVVGWAIWQSNVNPMRADIHSRRGTIALSQEEPFVALAEYRNAVKVQPQRAAYHVAVALTATQIGNFELAERAMRAAIALRPTDPVLYTQLATIYSRAATESPESVDMAYLAYEQAIALAPTIALTYQHYADFALRTGNWEVALNQAQQAVDLDATDGIAFGILGWSYMQHGNLGAAQDAFEQAVRWQPDSADSYVGLATVYFQQGIYDEARQAVRSSLLLDPNYEPALALQHMLSGQ